MRSEFLWATGARLFAVAAAFLAGVLSLKLYGRFFSPDQYGVIVVAMQIIGYLPMLDGGFRTTTNRLLLAIDQEPERERLIHFSQVFYSWLLVAAVLASEIAIIGYGVLGGGSNDFGVAFFAALGLAGALLIFAGAQAGLLLGLGAQASLSIISGMSSLAGVAVLAGSLAGGYGPWAFVFSVGTAALTTYGLAWLPLARLRPQMRWLSFRASSGFWTTFRTLRADSWRAFRSQLSILLLFSSDLILVAIFCSPAETAIYGVLSRLHGIARGFLQALNEAAWPLIARRSCGTEKFQSWLLQVNGWIYGLVGGGLLLVAPGFLGWYMGEAWVPSDLLNGLFVARFLIIGASVPASYFLLGLGDFRSIARCCEREVLVAVLLGLLMGACWKSPGVAVAFLLATNAGTFIPLWAAYSQRQRLPLLPLLGQVWLRIGTGLGATWALWSLGSLLFAS